MSVRKCLFRIWGAVTLVSILVDIACFWLVQHTPAAVPGSEGYNYITIFLVSAPLPFVLAPVLVCMGLLWGLLRSLWRAMWPAAGSAHTRRALVRARERGDGLHTGAALDLIPVKRRDDPGSESVSAIGSAG